MDGNGIGMFMEQGMRWQQHLPWDGVGCWLMPCPSWSVSQSCMRMKGSRPFCVSLLHGLGRDSMSLTLPWDRPSTWVWCRSYVLGCCLAIVPAEQDTSPAALGQGAGWAEHSHPMVCPNPLVPVLGAGAGITLRTTHWVWVVGTAHSLWAVPPTNWWWPSGDYWIGLDIEDSEGIPGAQ